MKNERGITLIALVTTTLILSIIAGVSIKIALGDDNSVVREVTNATETQQYMVNQEKQKTSNVIEKYEEEWDYLKNAKFFCK